MIVSDHFCDQYCVSVVEPALLVAGEVWMRQLWWPIIVTGSPWVAVTKRQGLWAQMSLVWMAMPMPMAMVMLAIVVALWVLVWGAVNVGIVPHFRH